MAAPEELFDDLDKAEAGVAEFAGGGDDRRSSRRRNTAKESHKAAINSYKESVLKGKTHGRQDELLETAIDDVYDVVDDDEYGRRVQQRLDGDDFIVDDEGDDMGYRDHGGELWDEEDFQGDSGAARRAQRGGRRMGGATKKPKAPVVKKRVNSLFTSAGGRNKSTIDHDGDDDLLKDLLSELGEDQSDTFLKKEKKRYFATESYVWLGR